MYIPKPVSPQNCLNQGGPCRLRQIVVSESTVINPTKIQTTPPWEFHPSNYFPRQHTGSPPKAVTNNGRHRIQYKITKYFILEETIK